MRDLALFLPRNAKRAGPSLRPSERSPTGAVAVAIGCSIVAALPGFLVGALAVQLTRELGFGVAGLGVAIALLRASSAISATYLGRLTDRMGAVVSLRLAAGLVAVVCAGVAVTAQSWFSLVIWLVLVGPAHSLATPAANRLLVKRVPSRRQGLAFGFKQSAPPLASMLAGFSVPLVAQGPGWRLAFVFCSVLAIVAMLFVGRRSSSGSERRRHPGLSERLTNRGALVALVVAFGLSTAASSTIPVFFVSSAVRAGYSEGIAGVLLAAASIAAVVVRIVMGGACDRMRSGYLRLCAWSLMVGVVGFAAMASGHPGLLGVGVIVAMGGAWGFAGAFWFAVITAYADTPGRVTGTLTPGGLIGGTVGPIVFGSIAESSSFSIGWFYGGVVAFLASTVMFLASRQLRPKTADEF